MTRRFDFLIQYKAAGRPAVTLDTCSVAYVRDEYSWAERFQIFALQKPKGL